MNVATAGPLLCGGITVFSPILDFDVKPTDHVGVVGIGGLGHMALMFLHVSGQIDFGLYLNALAPRWRIWKGQGPVPGHAQERSAMSF